MKRNATAVWQGGLKDGSGSISTETGTVADAGILLRDPLPSRVPAATPETGPRWRRRSCLPVAISMALSLALGDPAAAPERIDTTGKTVGHRAQR
ncbi:MAG: hypothetical protein U5L11_16715 [Arhodomonas sp.]|nr:hypothetical protein [Arhodomonas sp.]